MDIDDFLGVVFVLFLAVCVALAAIFVMTDQRHFGAIVKQCKEMGYIQDDTTRIVCSPEARP